MKLSHIAPCLDPAAAAAMPDLMRGLGPLEAYVQAPASDGVGKGLVRRHDAVLNYVRQKLARGESEPMHVTAARTNLFRRTFYERGVRLAPGAEALFDHPAFAAAATAIGARPIVRRTMLYANVLLPGQELAVHVDTPEFRGLDKQDVPEWLLVVMGASGLFERWRVRIAAAVSFFSGCAGGAFQVWVEGPDGPATDVPPIANSAVAVDADGCFHGVARVGGADAPAPAASPTSSIQWDGERWHLRDKDQEVTTYGWDDVRLSFQWKAQVLRSEDELEGERLDEASAVSTLLADLRERGVIGDEAPSGPRLGLTMIDAYLSFPGAT